MTKVLGCHLVDRLNAELLIVATLTAQRAQGEKGGDWQWEKWCVGFGDDPDSYTIHCTPTQVQKSWLKMICGPHTISHEDLQMNHHDPTLASALCLHMQPHGPTVAPTLLESSLSFLPTSEGPPHLEHNLTVSFHFVPRSKTLSYQLSRKYCILHWKDAAW